MNEKSTDTSWDRTSVLPININNKYLLQSVGIKMGDKIYGKV